VYTEHLPPRRAKHVIILGAGASASSDYPLANDLRLGMASSGALQEKIIQAHGNHNNLMRDFKSWIEPLETALKLFREGGFATVDEFSQLASSKFTKEIAALKKVLRLALSIHNPEEHYEKSDYYGFIQRLFRPNLFDLREDIVVLSFNYDVYLDYLLLRAAGTRFSIAGSPSGAKCFHHDTLTSGFSERDVKYIEDSDEFCLLKLHGSIAWPKMGNVGGERDSYVWYGDLFTEMRLKRLGLLTSNPVGASEAPIVFPWEIMDKTGSFVSESDFPCREAKNKNGRLHGDYRGDVSLFQLFKSIWTRARSEVFTANKISIVGLSMHDYLKPAFEFLFRNKAGSIDLVVADKYLEKYTNDEESHRTVDPISPATRLSAWLREFCPHLLWNVVSFGVSNGPTDRSPVDQFGRFPIRIRKSFEEFILKEMGPQALPKGPV
jgi:hypothetical protein